MKAWQIFAVGMAVVGAGLLLPAYESLIAGAAALVILAAVVAGFVVRPRREVFYIRTAVYGFEPDGFFTVEHDRIAVRVEMVRLWLLFPLTLAAVAFLLLTFLQGTPWRYRLGQFFAEAGPYPFVLYGRIFLAIVLGVLSTWTSERWILRDAEACSADSVSRRQGRISYSFRDRNGEYYGGEGFQWTAYSLPLANIVLYQVSKPDLSKIAVCCLFHRFVIIGHGLTDLDEETAVVVASARPASQSI